VQCQGRPKHDHTEVRRLRAEKARRNLHVFVVQAWPILEPATPFVNGIDSNGEGIESCESR